MENGVPSVLGRAPEGLTLPKTWVQSVGDR